MLEWLTQPIVNLFKFHKLKILTVFLSALVFFTLLFPLNDLNDYISSVVAKMTQNQVFLQFEELGFSFLTGPGIELKTVEVDTPHLDTVKADELILRPSLGSLFGSFGGSMSASGIFGGEISGSISQKEDVNLEFDVSTEGTNLKSLIKLLPIDGNLKGKLNANASGMLDASFRTQPKSNFNFNISSLNLAGLTIQTQMMPITLPKLNIKELILAGRLEDGNLHFDDFRIGKDRDDIVGTVKGKLGLRFIGTAQKFKVLPGAYNLAIRLKVKPDVEKNFAILFNGFGLNKYKNGQNFSFRASGTPGNIPKFDRL